MPNTGRGGLSSGCGHGAAGEAEHVESLQACIVKS